MTCELPAANSKFCAWKNSQEITENYPTRRLAHVYKDVCRTVFIIALFKMRKDGKLHTCASGDWLYKLLYPFKKKISY